MVFEMLRWWYSAGWLEALQRIGAWVKHVERAFSLTLLAQTLFSPWRRIISVSGKGVDAKMRAAMDNLVSRCVGFVIRFFVLIGALIAIAITLLGGIIMAALWPLWPLLIIFFAARAIIG